MKKISRGSIKKILVLLVVLSILPALLIILYSGFELRRNAIENAEKEVLFLSQVMGEVQKGITDSTRQILAFIAQMIKDQTSDIETVNSILRAAIKENPVYINLVLIDRYGNVAASALPFHQTNLSDRQHVQDAISKKTFVVGEYITTRIIQPEPSLAFSYPVLDNDNNVIFILAAVIRLDVFAQLFNVAQLKSDSFLAVTDRNGIRLFFHPPNEDTNPLGKPVTGIAWEKARGSDKPGLSRHKGSDGVKRVFAYFPLKLDDSNPPYMYMWSGIPESGIMQSANLILLRNLFFVLLSAVMAVFIIRLAGKGVIIAPITRLIDATRTFSFKDGSISHFKSSMGGSPDEFIVLADAFDEMAFELAKNQEKLRTIADYTYDWEYWTGPERTLNWVSPSCKSITGYDHSEFLNDPDLIGRIVHKEDSPVFMKHIESEISSAPHTDMQFRIIHKSGSIIWIDHHCVPLINSNGDFLGRRVSNRDITDRKQMEQSVLESEAQFRTLVEGAPDAIFVQTDYCFAYINEAGLKIFGAGSEEQLIGMPFIEQFHPDYREQVMMRIEQLNKYKKKVSRVHETCLQLDGKPVEVEISAVPVMFKGKSGALVFMQDITQRIQFEARLQQAQKLEAVGSLAGGIAHDFNNILFPIIGHSELLLEDLPDGSLERESVAEIHTAAMRAGSLVRQILSFSRQAEQQKIPLRIQQIIKEVGKLIRATIPANIEIINSIQADCGPVLADPTNIHQVVMNLVTNAYHAVEQTGGRISVSLKEVTVYPESNLGTTLKNMPYVLLTVSDDGCGIAPDILPRIFDPYFTTKEQGKGTGLGLSVVFGIVKDHDGDIQVYSEEGKGTSFNVYLPLLQRELAETEEAPAVLPTGNEHILIADDEDAIVSMIKKMLERLGYRVTAFNSGMEALKAFSADPAAFDLVITDMAMPGMTGIQLAEKMSALRPGIPVLLSTGFSEKMILDNNSTKLFQGFLMKPLIMKDLAHEVRRILDYFKEKSFI